MLNITQRIVLAVIVGLTVAVSAQTLTLTEAQRLALERSRQLVAQDYAATASREMAVAAGQLPDPVLSIGVENLPIEGSDQWSVTRDFMTMRRIGIMQEFTRRDKRKWRAERFLQEAEKTLVEKNLATVTIERETALAWLERYFSEVMASVLNEQLKEAKLELEAIESSYRAGRASQAEVLAAKSLIAGVEDQASDLQRRIATAKINLARWVGEAADAPLAGEPSLDAVHVEAHSLETQILNHPEIALLFKQEELATTEAALARANKRWDLSVGVVYSQRGSSYSDMVSLEVSVPIQWNPKNRQNKELAAKLAMVAATQSEKEEMLRAHVAELNGMLTEWQNNRERQARFEQERIPLARAQIEAVFAAYRGGKSNLAELLAARRNVLDIQMQALQLKMDTARLWARLNFLFPTIPIQAKATP